MKKSLFTLAILLCVMALFAQVNLPRTMYVRVVNADNSDLANFDGITFAATINSSPNTLTETSGDSEFFALSHGTYIKFQLGNFDNQWQLGNIVTLTVNRASDGFIGFADNIEVVDSSPIWWGRVGYVGDPVVIKAPPAVLFDSNDGDPILNEGLVMAPGYPMANVYRATGWGLNDDWNIQFSTEGFENITLTSKIRRQYWFDDEDTFEDYWGPRLFRTYYSTNGTEWTQYPVANYTLGTNEDWLTIAFDIPEDLWGLPNLQIKWELFNANGISNDGWGEIKDVLVTGDEIFVPPTDWTISGTVSGAHAIDGVMIDATDIGPEDITYNDATGEYSITVPDAWTGTVTPTKAGFIFVPANIPFVNVTEDMPNNNFTIQALTIPGAPTNLAPNAETLTYAEPTVVALTWEAPVTGHVDGYEVEWNGELQDPLGSEVLTWNTPALDEDTYIWKVRAFNNTEYGKSYVPTRVKITDRNSGAKDVRARENGPWAEATFVVEIERIIDPENPPVGIDVVEDIPVTTMPGTDSGIPAVTYGITATGVWDVIVTKPAGFGYPWFAFLNVIGGGSYASGPIAIDTYTFVGVDFGDAKGDAELILDDNEDITLPVELSSFNAVLTAQYFVKLTWISQSETNLNGYRVYRSENTELVNATMITPIIISATNTSSTQVYSIEDREVAFGNTYWYWLESVENDGSSAFHGPTSVFVEGEVPPVLPQATTMRSAYPNPFKAASTTTIEVAVKEGESGSLTIYNVLGQVVKTYSLNQGIHNLKWNGKDNKGNICSSGIYFYKLSTPTMNQTKKMVIVK